MISSARSPSFICSVGRIANDFGRNIHSQDLQTQYSMFTTQTLEGPHSRSCVWIVPRNGYVLMDGEIHFATPKRYPLDL
jgi:hypothetical protein